MESPTVRRSLKRKCSELTRSDTSETSPDISLRRKISNTRMHKSPKTPAAQQKGTALKTASNSTPRKKSYVNKGLKGQKWFKGTPKSRSNHRLRPSQQLPKSSPQDSAVQASPLPPSIVEFEVDGVTERKHVSDVFLVIDKDPDIEIIEGPDVAGKDQNGTSSLNTPSPHPLIWSSTLEKKVIRTKASKDKKMLAQLRRQKGGNYSIHPDDKKTQTKLPEANFRILEDNKMQEAPPRPNAYIRYIERPLEDLAEEVEYDIDEEDCAWLCLANDLRRSDSLPPVSPETMELLMDRLEKESYFQMQSTGMDQGPLIDDDAVCCICMDGECQNSNAILFCDMCNLAVHQECYGVPYIPEGQWLCRRCLQSPSRAVDCVLCPNKCGAFKQTDDSRWAHVVCAIWIPEVCFANTVFLEPIDSIGNIPPARWRLSCYICKQKGVGACIQCHKSNCYTAFHVTCAQQAGLCMKMDTVREASAIIVKKTAFCDNHAPPEVDSPSKDGDGTPSPRQKMRQTRKLLAEKRSAIPVVSIPTIPVEKIAEICSNVSFSHRRQFVKRLMAYWKLKRQSRNGVPLLRRLQAASSAPNPSSKDCRPKDATEMAATQAYYNYFMRLRQDLERARLLCELIRKREKVKRELMYLQSRELDLKLRPFTLFLLNVLDEISSKDSLQIFAEPVNPAEVPDYLTVVKQPMDLSTMREKVNCFQYNSVEELETDFNLMIDNCLTYNSKDTIFYRSAVKLRELGGIILRQAKREFLSIGYDQNTGMHLPERPYTPEVLNDEKIISEVEKVFDDASRHTLEHSEHITLLEDVLDKTLSLTHPVTRKNRYSRVKAEIAKVKRLHEQKLEKGNQNAASVSTRKTTSFKSPPEAKPSTSESPQNKGSAYDFELSDDYESCSSPCVTSDAWRKRFPNSKSSAKVSINALKPNHQNITPASKETFKVLSPKLSSPPSSKRALRPPKQKSPTLSPLVVPASAGTSVVSPSRSTRLEKKSPVKKVSPVVSLAVGKLAKSIRESSPNKAVGIRKSTVKPKPNSDTSTVRQYSRREQKEMRAAVMTHQKVSISMALAAERQICDRGDIGDLKERNSPRTKNSTSISPTNINKRTTNVSVSPKLKTKTPIVSTKKLEKCTNGIHSNEHVSPKSKINSRDSSVNTKTSQSQSPSPTRKPVARKKTAVVQNKRTVKTVSSTNNNKISNNINWCLSNRPSPNSSIINQKISSPLRPTPKPNLLNHRNNTPVKTFENSTVSTNKKRKNTFANIKESPAIGTMQISHNDKTNVAKSDSFMVYRSGGADDMNSNSEDEDNDEDEEIDEEEESGEDEEDESAEESEEDEIAVEYGNVEANKQSEDDSGSESDSSKESSQSSDSSSSSSSEASSGKSSWSEASSILSESPAKVPDKFPPTPPKQIPAKIKASRISSSSSEDSPERPLGKFPKESALQTPPKKDRASSSSSSNSKAAKLYEMPLPSPDIADFISSDKRNVNKRVQECDAKKAQKTVKRLDFRQFNNDDAAEKSSCEASNNCGNEFNNSQDKSDIDDEEGYSVHSPNKKKLNSMSIALQPFDLVWARSKEGQSYPALIINPEMQAGYTKNGVAIPCPPREILEKRFHVPNSSEQVFLVLFFDHKGSWEWITRSKLQQLGINASLDKERLMEIRKPSEKKAVRQAYEKAILHGTSKNGNRTLMVDNLGD